LGFFFLGFVSRFALKNPAYIHPATLTLRGGRNEQQCGKCVEKISIF
jgi:hypothetical protein